MEMIFIILFGAFLGFSVKILVNWLSIDQFVMENMNPMLEIMGIGLSTWAFLNLSMPEAFVFSLVSLALAGISVIDYHTFQVPLIFIIIGIAATLIGILFDVIFISAALWGIFVGAFIPLAIMGTLWTITKRQGMGYGDIQMGIVLGAWLGPMRMALTLFGASVLSLLAWIGVSLVKGFDKDRAMPMGPFLSFAGTGAYIGSFYYPEFFHLLIIH
jgi:prepilin signal peptidase PulO-like enzyme (type II secretory pathway)